MNNIPQYQFRKTKYGSELLIDLIRLESLETYIRETPRHLNKPNAKHRKYIDQIIAAKTIMFLPANHQLSTLIAPTG